MADIADISDERIEKSLQDAIRTASLAKGPEATGRCLYCDEIVADTMRWCDAGCRDGWEKDQKRGRG